MSTHEMSGAQERRATDTITIDFLFLDLTSCERCVGTGRNLETALVLVGDILAATAATVQVRKTLVETAEQARALRFASSPTIRIDGHDIALGLKETQCESEACSCAAGGPIACRVWTYRGREYTEAPVGLIVDAIFGQLYGRVARREALSPQTYQLPQNLASFFTGKSYRSNDPSPCCGPAEQTACCEASEKSSCCGRAASAGCGCR